MEKLYPGGSPLKGVRLLIVGAGGIGCELAKILVLSGADQLYVIDLDTIDVSNLNRQFLFRRQHVGLSKAKILAQQLRRPGVVIEWEHASILEPRFSVEWISSFKLVFNALDNIGARKHVNRLCVAADKVLIDAGTNGFKGNSSVIIPHRTRCYECTVRPLPR